MEFWDLYDEKRNKVGKTHQRGVPLPEGYFHLVVHVFIQNNQGEILLSKRHPDKPWGEFWECAGGSVLAGENSLDGALREVKEELGISLHSESGKLLQHGIRKTHHTDYWLFRGDFSLDELTLQKDEVIDAKWVNRIEYEGMVKNGETVPTLLNFYQTII